jgi:hypothetical protein
VAGLQAVEAAVAAVGPQVVGAAAAAGHQEVGAVLPKISEFLFNVIFLNRKRRRSEQ